MAEYITVTDTDTFLVKQEKGDNIYKIYDKKGGNEYFLMGKLPDNLDEYFTTFESEVEKNG